jgi:hypothetical protein
VTTTAEGESPERADDAGGRLLDRLERWAAVLLVAGALLAWILAGPRETLGLTLGGAASIFGFRSLRGLVGSLAPTASGRVSPGVVLLLILRGSVLGALAVAVYLFGSSLILPLLVGVSVIPAALMLEAGRRLIRLAAGEEPHG